MRHVTGNLWVQYDWDWEANAEYQPGYYFSDETEQLHGPYPTSGDALVALDIYAAQL